MTTKSIKKQIKIVSTRVLRSYKTKCQDCHCPFLLNKKTSQRRYCFSCVKRRIGVISNCLACSGKYLKFKNSKNQFCYSCVIGINSGVKLNCHQCHSDFYSYKNKNLSLKSLHQLCYSCFLVKFGVLLTCIDCNNEFYVDKEKKEWKVRCSNCYMFNK
jgi:hypothetical protein